MGAAALAKHHCADWPPSSVHNLDSGYTTVHLTLPSQKRRKLLIKLPAAVCSAKRRTPPASKKAEVQRPDMSASRVGQTKSKRVRTGCLTCRTRHLKCDEGTPDCGNCRKSNRVCKRGVRLNFIDLTCKEPPFIPPTDSWSVEFLDESRATASEYQGGLEKYPQNACDSTVSLVNTSPRVTGHPDESTSQSQSIGRFPDTPRSIREDSYSVSTPLPQYMAHQIQQQPVHEPQDSGASRLVSGALSEDDHWDNLSTGAVSGTSVTQVPDNTTSPKVVRESLEAQKADNAPAEETSSERRLLDSPEEMHLMQTYIKEVGVWMDCLDSKRHFSQIVPYQALRCPMLLNALLSCGAMRLSQADALLNEKALFYYDTATTQLLRSLQNPERDTAECAVTAVVLNMYEVMSEKPQSRMSHIAGARALIRECGWNAQSEGIGGACFWFSVSLELSSCLSLNYKNTWDPDDWGMDLGFLADAQLTSGPNGKVAHSQVVPDSQGEEIWARRMFYIVAKIADLRANLTSPAGRSEARNAAGGLCSQWYQLSQLCDFWNASVRAQCSLMATSLLSIPPEATCFPESGSLSSLPLSAAFCITQRGIFWHSATLGGTSHPKNVSWPSAIMHSRFAAWWRITITAGNAFVAFRTLTVVAEVLDDPDHQHAALALLGGIHHQSGWKLSAAISNLKKIWGWEEGQDADFARRDREDEGQHSQGRTPTKQESDGHVDMSSLPMMSGLYTSQNSLEGDEVAMKRSTMTPSPSLPAPTALLPSQHGYFEDKVQGGGQTHNGQFLQQYHRQRQHGLSQEEQQYQYQQQIMALSQPPQTFSSPHPARVNPLQMASFDSTQHPYQSWYQPPASDGDVSSPYQQNSVSARPQAGYGSATPYPSQPRPSTG